MQKLFHTAADARALIIETVSEENPANAIRHAATVKLHFQRLGTRIGGPR
jgi:hypothetical protein